MKQFIFGYKNRLMKEMKKKNDLKKRKKQKHNVIIMNGFPFNSNEEKRRRYFVCKLIKNLPASDAKNIEMFFFRLTPPAPHIMKRTNRFTCR